LFRFQAGGCIFVLLDFDFQYEAKGLAGKNAPEMTFLCVWWGIKPQLSQKPGHLDAALIVRSIWYKICLIRCHFLCQPRDQVLDFILCLSTPAGSMSASAAVVDCKFTFDIM